MSEVQPANYKQLITRFQALPADIQSWFPEFTTIIGSVSYSVTVSYLFLQFEHLKRWVLYRGLVKRHQTNSELTWEMIDKDHMSRARFRELFEIVYDVSIPVSIRSLLERCEAVRDKVAHGKSLTDRDARLGIAATFEMFCEFDKFVTQTADFSPFAHGKGFKGAQSSLSKETTRWVLKGMGIPSAKCAP